MDRCPTCGGHVEFDNMIVDLDENAVIFQGRKTYAGQPKIAELIYILRQAWPEMVRHRDMVAKLWNCHFEPANSFVAVRVYISKARKVLRPLGILIQTFDRRGYRLVLPTRRVRGSL